MNPATSSEGTPAGATAANLVDVASPAPPLDSIAISAAPLEGTVEDGLSNLRVYVCNKRGYNLPPDCPPVPCQNTRCIKVFHITCSEGKDGYISMPKLEKCQLACTKACCNKLSNLRKLNWTNDGKDGLED
eukprot:IDg1460t1